nr:EOG090X05QS [Simocephalus serrulatus]
MGASVSTSAGRPTSDATNHSINQHQVNNSSISTNIKRASRTERRHRQQQDKDDLSLWIDQQQVKMFSGFPMEIYIAADGRVLSYILDPNFEKYLPIIPSEVGYVNFTWKSGENKKYYYHFDRLQSFNEDILQPPTVSVETRGRVPRKPKVFSVLLPCSGNSSGVASFSIGLLIESHKGKPLPGTPLRLRLRKECAERVNQVSGGGAIRASVQSAGSSHLVHHLVPSPHASTSSASAWPPLLSSVPDPLVTHGGQNGLMPSTASASSRSRLAFTGLRHDGPDPECDKKCANGGWCNHDKICQCPEGYMGQHCRTALCYPQCMNGGSCTSPGMCSCPSGFQGRHCEGGICKEKCLNGGKCIQKDTCDCPKGFYGLRCEFSTYLILSFIQISPTPSAVKRVKELFEGKNDYVGLKIGVKQRGCNGLSYTLDFAKQKEKFDEEVVQDGVRIFVDIKAQLHLLGTEMDFVENELSSEFVFNNPNIKGTCGCGESFSV